MTDVLAVRLQGTDAIRPSDSAPVTRNLELRSATLPDPQSHEVVVEPLFVGICGSDNSASLGKPNFSWVQRPRTIGHECSGRIVAMGATAAEESGLEVGDAICVIPMLGCGDPRCRGCRSGKPNYCRQKTIFGFHRDGAMAEAMVVEAARCMKLRPALSPLEGALIEPLSVVAQAICRKCSIQPGMDVVVTGCGIIGLMAAELARAAGARVAITGLEADRDVRLKLARERGFLPIEVGPEAPLHEQLAAGVDDLDGRRFGDTYERGTVDVLIECSGAPPALATAGLALQLEGHICVIATFGSEVPFLATEFTRAGQSMQGVMGSSRSDFEVAQSLLERRVFPADVYSQVYPLADALQAFHDSITAQTTKAVLQVHG